MGRGRAEIAQAACVNHRSDRPDYTWRHAPLGLGPSRPSCHLLPSHREAHDAASKGRRPRYRWRQLSRRIEHCRIKGIVMARKSGFEELRAAGRLRSEAFDRSDHARDHRRDQLRRPQHPFDRRTADLRRTGANDTPRWASCSRRSRGAMRLHNCPPAPWSTRSARGSCSPRGWHSGRWRRPAEGWLPACGSSSPRASRSASARRLNFRRARVVSNWYHIRERGLPTGIFNSSSSLGPALAPPLLTALMAAFGWRRMFFIMGALGLIAAVVWYIFYRDPQHAGLSEADLQSLRADEPPSSGDVALAQWLRLFRHQTTWGMVLGFAGALYLIWLYLTWLPGYLRVQHHMTRLQVGFAASVPFIFGFLGSLAGGAVSDRLAARGISPINSRKLPIAAGLIGMALFTVPAALTHDRNVAVGLHRPGHVLRQRGHGQCMGTGHGDGPVGLCRVAGLDPELRGILRRLVCTCDHRQSRGSDRLLHAGSPVRSGRRRRVGARVSLRGSRTDLGRVSGRLRKTDRLTFTEFAPPRTPPEPARRSCQCPSRASGRCALRGRASNTLCTRHSWARSLACRSGRRIQRRCRRVSARPRSRTLTWLFAI